MRIWLNHAFVPAVQIAKCRAGVVSVWSGDHGQRRQLVTPLALDPSKEGARDTA
jgi:hypothetical protein